MGNSYIGLMKNGRISCVVSPIYSLDLYSMHDHLYVGLNSGSGFASFGEPVVLGDQLGQHSTTIALIRANWTHRCRESYDPIP